MSAGHADLTMSNASLSLLRWLGQVGDVLTIRIMGNKNKRNQSPFGNISTAPGGLQPHGSRINAQHSNGPSPTEHAPHRVQCLIYGGVQLTSVQWGCSLHPQRSVTLIGYP